MSQEPHPAFNNALLTEIEWVQANGPTSHTIKVRGRDDWRAYDIVFGLASSDEEDRVIRMIFNGTSAECPGEFAGLSSLYSTMNPHAAQNAVNVFDGGGRGYNNSSIYLVVWSPETVFMAYRRNEDEGLLAGLVIKDWRYVVRIANIDVGKRNADVPAIMSVALLTVPTFRGRAVFYVGSEVRSMLLQQAGDGVSHRNIPVRCAPCLDTPEAPILRLAA